MSTTVAVSQDTFQQLAEPYRHQLQVHCYRMLGSLLEAEDLVLPTENLILYAQRGLLKEPVSVPDLRFFCGR